MGMVFILVSLIIGCILLGILFGVTILLSNTRAKMLGSFLMPIVSILPTVILFSICRVKVLHIENVLSGIDWIMLIVTDAIVIILITSIPTKINLCNKQIVLNGFEGIAMEIPQRMFMQTLIFQLLLHWNVNNAGTISVVVNGVVWCIGIMAQALIIGQKFKRTLFIEVISSFVFSLGIGFIFVRTQLIILPMIAHFIERVVSKYILSINLNLVISKRIRGNTK